MVVFDAADLVVVCRNRGGDLMTPTHLQKQLGIAPAMALQANSLAIVALTVGCIFFGWLNDRFSSGLIFIAGSIGLGGGIRVLSRCCGRSIVVADPLPWFGFFVGLSGLSLCHGKCLSTGNPFFRPLFSYNLSYAILAD